MCLQSTVYRPCSARKQFTVERQGTVCKQCRQFTVYMKCTVYMHSTVGKQCMSCTVGMQCTVFR